MPVRRHQSKSQRMRWEGGRLQLARRDGPRLVLQGILEFNWHLFDWGMDLVIPPLAALTLMILAGTLVAGVTAFISATWLAVTMFGAWIGLLVAVAGFVIIAMLAGHLPGKAYTALLNAPGYIVWKVWIYVLMLLRRVPQQWIRTERTRIQDNQ